MKARRTKRVQTLAPEHQRAALPLHIIIVLIFGILALVCIGGGIYAVYRNSLSQTGFSFLGVHLNTGHVGVAFVGLGLIVAFFTARAVLRSQRDLGGL
jgi:hypothetical protein